MRLDGGRARWRQALRSLRFGRDDRWGTATAGGCGVRGVPSSLGVVEVGGMGCHGQETRSCPTGGGCAAYAGCKPALPGTADGRRAWECPPYRTANGLGRRQAPAEQNGLGGGSQLPGLYGEGFASTPPSCCSSGWCRNVQARLTRKFQNMTTATATRKACIS